MEDNRMRVILAEKPSVAQSIAAVLGANQKKNGYLQGENDLVSWCIGHLIELAPPEIYDARYAKWRREDLPIVPSVWESVVSDGTKKQFAVLKELLKDAQKESPKDVPKESWKLRKRCLTRACQLKLLQT